jgi:periplasmic protein TonB
MIVSTKDKMPFSGTGNPANARYVLAAALVSVLLHVFLASNWHAPAAEALTNKPPMVMEVEMVIPPPPPPVEKKAEAPKPKAVVKPKPVEKVKVKPVVPPKPKVVQPPKPVASKAPPKVVQKTYTEAAPEVKTVSPGYTPVPVFGSPNAKPTKNVATPPAAAKAPVKAEAGGGGNFGMQVLQRVEPKYPARALSRRMEGKVTLQFTVLASGQIDNPRVVSATPSGIFESAALDAIHRWRFKPKIVNGKPVSQQTVQTINFKIRS